MITGADVGSLMSATHDEPDSVSKLNGPDFSILKVRWTGLEIAHLFLVAIFRLLCMQKTQMAIETTTSDDVAETQITRVLVFDLGLVFLACK
jgi:hypothetical protein